MFVLICPPPPPPRHSRSRREGPEDQPRQRQQLLHLVSMDG